MDPQWMTLNNMYTQAKIQQLLMGQVTVKDALKDLHENLEKLHAANQL
jgi:hypothetical protein